MRRIVKKYLVPHQGNDFRPYLLRGAGVAGLLILIIGLLFSSELHRLALRESDFLASVLPPVLVDLANDDRTDEDLAPLVVNPLLEEAARMKAQDMASKGYFAHISPEGVTPWFWFTRTGYQFAYAGENLAIYFDDSAAVNAAWMASPGHKANIVNDRFTEIGVATARGVYEGRETTFVVQMFGRPLAQAASAQPPLAVAPASSETSVDEASVEVSQLATRESEEGGVAQSFVAVENAENLAAGESPVAAPRYASIIDAYISSPGKLLALAYAIISVLLILMLVAALAVTHDYKKHHMLTIVAVMIVIVACYYGYQALAPSGVELALAPR